jgi:hypothetical protein
MIEVVTNSVVQIFFEKMVKHFSAFMEPKAHIGYYPDAVQSNPHLRSLPL